MTALLKKSKQIMSTFLGLHIPYPGDMQAREAHRAVMLLAFPTLAELLLTQLSSIVDNAMVGNLGTWALSAVGYCTQPIFLMSAVLIALNTGATVVIARSKGAKDARSANSAMHQAMTLTVIISILLSIAGYIAARPMVIAMGAQTPEAIEAAADYFRIRMLFFPASALTLIITASLRGVGRSKVCMVYNIVANIVNVPMNWIMIYGKFGFPAMGVAGAAWATNIGQGVALVIALVTLARGCDMLKLRLRLQRRLEKRLVKEIARVGAPAMLEQVIMRAGMLLYVRIIASLGEDVYAAHIIAQSIMVLSITNGQAFGVAATTLMGQAFGADRIDRGRAHVQICSRISMIVSVAMMALFVWFGAPIAGLYTDSEVTIREAANMLRLVALMQPLLASQLVLAGALRGAGDTAAVARYTAIGILGIRPVLCVLFVLVFRIGLLGAWLAYLCDQSWRSVVTLRYFYRDRWLNSRGKGRKAAA